jgi:hypothetical protein
VRHDPSLPLQLLCDFGKPFSADGMNKIGDQFRQRHDHKGISSELDIERLFIE